MKTTRFIALTSPAGLWTPRHLVGAVVRIKSTSVSSGLFGYDSESLYKIADIGFRISKTGKSFAVIRLEGITDREFTWKDLEILSITTNIYQRAVCGQFCVSNSLCGYRVSTGVEDTVEDGDNLTNRDEISTVPEDDGDLLD